MSEATKPEKKSPFCKCQNCGHVARYDDLPDAENVDQRHTFGDVFSDVECPECHAICLPLTIEDKLEMAIDALNAAQGYLEHAPEQEVEGEWAAAKNEVDDTLAILEDDKNITYEPADEN